MNLQC